MVERIGLMGGSFDPPHVGHKTIAAHYLKYSPIDALWVLPVASHPFDDKKLLTSFKDRVAMLELLFYKQNKLKIVPTEQQLPYPNYTINTLRYLKQKYPTIDFSLCIGADNLASFHKWHAWEQILELVTLIVAPRPGQSVINNRIDPEKLIYLAEVESVNYSSTEIRNEIYRSSKLDKGTLDRIGLPQEVYNYIVNKRLFKTP